MLKAQKGRVIVKRGKDPTHTAGGIEIPESYRKAHAKWSGTVITAGEDTGVTPGQVVWFERVRMEPEVEPYGKVAVVDLKDLWGVEVDDG